MEQTLDAEVRLCLTSAELCLIRKKLVISLVFRCALDSWSSLFPPLPFLKSRLWHLEPKLYYIALPRLIFCLNFPRYMAYLILGDFFVFDTWCSLDERSSISAPVIIISSVAPH